MTDLANTLRQRTEKSLIQVGYFLEDRTQDPEQWFKEFQKVSTANRWIAT